MKVCKATIRFLREDEYHGRAPRIIVSAEGRLGDAIAIFPCALLLVTTIFLIMTLRQSAAPLLAYSIILPIIGLGVVKTLEARHMARLAAARVPVRCDMPN